MRFALAAIVCLLFAMPAQARDFRVQQVPNGPRFSCDVCHEPGNTGYVNPFGVQVLEALSDQNVVWSELAALDADGDGYPNGLELGDPDGTWSMGDPHPGGAPTNPGNYDSNLCGNGIEEANEECENGEVGDMNCQDAGFHAGQVVCNSICRIDTSFCINCGNGTVDADEECEGSDVKGRTCQSLGYDGGTLGCLTNCTLDTSACTGEPTPICGDGFILGSEECEGENLGGASCVTVGFEDGGLLRCNDDCTFDFDRCLGTNSDEEEDRTEVPGAGPDLPPGAFAGDDDAGGCASGGRSLPSTPWLAVALAGLVLLRRRRSFIPA